MIAPLSAEAAAPGPGFTATCTVAAWLNPLLGKTVAYLLVSHKAPRWPGETAVGIERDLRALAASMSLSPASDRVPSIGPRLQLRPGVLVLDYGHPRGWMLRAAPPAQPWRRHLLAGGEVCVIVSLDPPPEGDDAEVIERHLTRTVKADRAFMGYTSWRRG
ncbi:hypothetical protein [Streptomyces sp. NPDC047046]|uniref:hypothetical protein n=1 Tax=Streptomyces sp. NPDC047046 TaxID=3155378 RepID=UPI0033C74859